jgi:hypothetical protein
VPRRSTTLSLYVPTPMSARPFANVQAHEKANKELAKAQSALEKAQHGKLTKSNDNRSQLMFQSTPPLRARSSSLARSTSPPSTSTSDYTKPLSRPRPPPRTLDMPWVFAIKTNIRTDIQHHTNAAERESKLASLHAQSETGTGIAAPHGQTAAPVAGAPVAGAPISNEAGYAQQPIAGQQAVGGVPQQTTAAYPTEGQQVTGAVRQM